MPKLGFARIPSPLEDILVIYQSRVFILTWVDPLIRGRFLIAPSRWMWTPHPTADPIDFIDIDYIKITSNFPNRLPRDLSVEHVNQLMDQRDKLHDGQIAALLALILTGQIK